MMRRLYGEAGHDLTLQNPALPGVVLHYTALHQILADVSDARVYGGIHFLFDQDAGDRLGREVATFVEKNYPAAHPPVTAKVDRAVTAPRRPLEPSMAPTSRPSRVGGSWIVLDGDFVGMAVLPAEGYAVFLTPASPRPRQSVAASEVLQIPGRLSTTAGCGATIWCASWPTLDLRTPSPPAG